MTMGAIRGIAIVAAAAGLLTLGACSTEKMVDNTVDGTLFVGKTAVKGTVGAGKLAVKGAGAAVGAATDGD